MGLSTFSWNNVPQFAVICGPNGSGKTQLLEAIRRFVTAPNHKHGSTEKKPVIALDLVNQVCVDTKPYGKSEAIFLPSKSWECDLGIGKINHNAVAGKWDALVTACIQNKDAADHRGRAARNIIARLPDRVAITKENIKPLITAKDIARPGFGSHHIGLLFYAYHNMRLKAMLNNDTAFEAKNGEPPWVILDRLLEDFELPVRFSTPENLPILENFECNLEHRESKAAFKYDELSSGEQILLNLALWLLRSYQNTDDPSLLLLDEPDSHLHPSNARRLLDVLHRSLVVKRGIRVLMTTHSPSTVAMAPESSVFMMTANPTTITQVPVQKAIASLTSGFVVVQPGLRYVIVEDQQDVDVYQAWFSLGVDLKAIKPEPPLAFVSAGKDRRDQPSGGRNDVLKWVGKLQEAGLEHFRGIVDHDGKPISNPLVCQIGRYGIENYLLEPFFVYAHLLERDAAPPIAGIPNLVGKEASIGELSKDQLQLIADTIHGSPTLKADSLLSSWTGETFAVALSNGVQLHYPTWLRDTQGHELMNAYRRAFSPVVFPTERLVFASRRVQLMPVDVFAVLRILQESSGPTIAGDSTVK